MQLSLLSPSLGALFSSFLRGNPFRTAPDHEAAVPDVEEALSGQLEKEVGYCMASRFTSCLSGLMDRTEMLAVRSQKMVDVASEKARREKWKVIRVDCLAQPHEVALEEECLVVLAVSKDYEANRSLETHLLQCWVCGKASVLLHLTDDAAEVPAAFLPNCVTSLLNG